MNIKKQLFLLLSVSALSMTAGNHEVDSVAFVNADWNIVELPEGITCATTTAIIFDSPQSISYAKFPMSKFQTILIPQPKEGLKKMSEAAIENDAICGINAGYWNMSIDFPATYVRSNGQDLSKTESREAYRVNGIVIFDDGNFDIAYCDTTQYPEYAAKFNNILSCGPLLIDEGKVYDYSKSGSFFSNRHPRSVIGTTPDGDMILLVVDGRARNQAAGVSIPELTDICLWLGMDDALNLDGGGSSSLWVKGEIISHPSDNRKFDHEGERTVSSAIIVK